MTRLGIGLGLNKTRKNVGGSGVLDQYPGFAAGFSLRYLTDAFTGDVILVRRSSDNAELGFTPDEITDGTLTTWVGANDGYIKIWYNQLGSNNAVQNTNANQPLIVSSGSLNTVNSLPAIIFTGTQFLLTSSYIVELSQNDVSVFIVKSDGGNATLTSALMSEGDSVSPYSSQFVVGGTTGNNSVIWINGTDFGTDVSGQLLVGFDVVSGACQTYVNGSTSGSSGSPTINAETSTGTYIGSRADGTTTFYSGNVQEIITYKSDQSASRSAIETEINLYYSIY